MDDNDNKIKIFASDDDLKALGELLSNATSRKIIKNLMEHQMYTNEIATKLDMRVSLVIHHLKKMEALGLLEITDKRIKRKGNKHRFFKMNSDIFITLDTSKEEIEKKEILKRIFRDGIKFTAIALSIITTWFSAISNNIPRGDTYEEEAIINDPTIVILILCGLSVAFIIKIKKRKRD